MLANNTLEELDLSSNGIGAADGLQLAEMLEVCMQLYNVCSCIMYAAQY